MAQAILAWRVEPKGHKGKGKKRKEVHLNVGDFPIGAHGGSLEIGPIIRTLVFLANNIKMFTHIM
jgi:hypothetical protein